MRFGQYAPHSGPAVPLFVAGDAEPPPELATGSLFKADALDGGAASHSPSLFWAAALVGGWARQYFSSTQPVVASWTDVWNQGYRAVAWETLSGEYVAN